MPICIIVLVTNVLFLTVSTSLPTFTGGAPSVLVKIAMTGGAKSQLAKPRDKGAKPGGVRRRDPMPTWPE